MRGSNSASRRIVVHGESCERRVVAANRHRRVPAVVSVRRARLGVPAVAGGADERGIGLMPQPGTKTL